MQHRALAFVIPDFQAAIHAVNLLFAQFAWQIHRSKRYWKSAANAVKRDRTVERTRHSEQFPWLVPNL